MLMSVTGSARAANTPLMRQVEKIAASPILHGSDALCRLLRYLAYEAIENPGASIKEYRIATEVFGRSQEFDPKLDSTVRVQTGRLRSKLAEYYSTLGSRDEFLIEVPKGAYLLLFHSRNDRGNVAPAVVSTTPAPAQPRNHNWMILAGAALAVVAGFVLLWARYATPAANWRTMLKAEGIQGSDLTILGHFWGAFCKDDDGPIVVYSNAEFIGRPESGMRYLQPSDPKNAILDHYTGVGEVMAMHDIDYVFSGLHSALRVKRGRLLTFDDAQSNDLIFVGSPSENLTLRDLPITQDFVFRRSTAPGHSGDLTIVNVHPQPGEPLGFMANPELPVREDYAVMSMIRNKRHTVLILAGASTFGTQAAVEFVCNPDRLKELLQRVSGRSDQNIRPFEAVLRVTVSKGVPIASKIETLHILKVS